MTTTTSSPLLVVEDNQEDFEATTRALTEAGCELEVVRCETGDSALDYLEHCTEQGTPTAKVSPVLILLDLNLPGTDGREVLRALKGNVRLKGIPVVVLTTSANGVDVHDCYSSGANGYLQKPSDMDGFLELVRSLADFWFERAILPSGVVGT